MTSRALMIQGTGSDVGKSLLVAGLCRLARRRGLRVRPFKPQNMANNAAVAEGGEIGRAQALQALACGVPPSVHMNPVLLKPQSDIGAQVVVQGRVRGNARAAQYQAMKPGLLAAVLESFAHLRAEADLVLVEGAGSPAEVNLRAGDIANMGFATAAGVPVILCGDIDRGGLIAALVGTHALLAEAERALVRGFIVNRFRGDPALFAEGVRIVEARTGWRGHGILPYLSAASALPAEDAAGLGRGRGQAAGEGVHIAALRLPRIANFDDLDPLRLEPGVHLDLVEPGRPIPATAALVIIPGSKSTLADLAFLRLQGWDIDIAAHLRRGGRLLGLCGGYQMLGRRVADPAGVEGPPGEAAGLGYLDFETVLSGEKMLTRAQGRHVASDAAVTGYEMHMGRSAGPALARPFLLLDGGPDGAVSADGRVAGCYLHGLFAADGFRKAFLAELGAASSLDYAGAVEAALDGVADAIERHLDTAAILAAAA
ncbi:MAG: cobyric acid synthase [Thalassobaculales bacterium]